MRGYYREATALPRQRSQGLQLDQWSTYPKHKLRLRSITLERETSLRQRAATNARDDELARLRLANLRNDNSNGGTGRGE